MLEDLLRQRARELARPLDQTRPAPLVVVFQLGQQRCGLPLDDLARIEKLGPLTPLPGTRPEVAGLVSAMGRISAALWLGNLLGLENGQGSHGLFLRGESCPLCVDEVETMVRVETVIPWGAEPPVEESPGQTPDGILLLAPNFIRRRLAELRKGTPP